MQQDGQTLHKKGTNYMVKNQLMGIKLRTTNTISRKFDKKIKKYKNNRYELCSNTILY